MKKPETLKKIKRIAELFVEIREDNNLLYQDTDRHARLVAEARGLLAEEDVIELTSSIEEIFVLIDINEDFTRMKGSPYKNPYMEAIINPTNGVAKRFHEEDNKLMLVINDEHTEDSVEFETLNPGNPLVHCIKGTHGAEYVDELKWVTGLYPVFKKNTTMSAHAPGYLDIFNIFPNLKRVYFAGGVTDICYIEGILPTIKYFDQHNIPGIEVIAVEEIYDTYDAPWHAREEWNNMAERFITQAGAKLIKKL